MANSNDGGDYRGAIRSALAATLGLGALPGTALAHAGHGTREITALPLAVFGAGLLVLVTGLYLDARADVETLYANAGIAIGVAGLLAAIGLFLF